ncbi:VOC family protein [Chitinophaga filiformis]|uniref:VOC family protein n=1 Tax=Chitinophaga filiformis TaxID=104663 RepID=UPI001F1908F3|nr:VOC family protein [Chitinophaga filiformis]MCF6405226.1 VOC family protein [Chitinophaga filiformis]
MAALNPYLIFNGNCEEAFNFYKSVFGVEFQMISKFKDIPGHECPVGDENKIMHVALPIGKDGDLLMGSDSGMGEVTIGNNFAISVSASSEEETKKFFNGLSEGGKITMPLASTFWSPLFGMLTDKYGVDWMLGVNNQQS